MRISDLQDDPRRMNKVTVDPDLCMGCMKCIRTCCYDVYEWDPVEKMSTAAYPEECASCYQCMYFCPYIRDVEIMAERKICFFSEE